MSITVDAAAEIEDGQVPKPPAGSDTASTTLILGDRMATSVMTAERQVVYILVELRNLLERNNTLDNYETLETVLRLGRSPESGHDTREVAD